MCVLFRFHCPRRTTRQMSKHITLLNSDKALLSGSHNTSSSSGILGHTQSSSFLTEEMFGCRSRQEPIWWTAINPFCPSLFILPEFGGVFFDVSTGIGRSTFCLFRLQVFLICLSIVPKWRKLRKVFTVEVSTNKYVLKYYSYVLSKDVLLELASYLVTSHTVVLQGKIFHRFLCHCLLLRCGDVDDMKNKAQLRNDERCQVWIIFICGESAGGRGGTGGRGGSRGWDMCNWFVSGASALWWIPRSERWLAGVSACVSGGGASFLSAQIFHISDRKIIRHIGECAPQPFFAGKYKPSALWGFGQFFVTVKGDNWRI